MKYIRSRPWRSRGPWFSNRAGARRRGYRDDELCSVAHDPFQDGDDVVISVESESATADDVLLPDAASRPIPESMLAARVDMSGLQAIASRVPGALPTELSEDTILPLGWFAHTEQSDESSLSRHFA